MCIYLVLVAWVVSVKLIPTFAGFMIEQGKSVITTVTGAGAPILRRFRGGMRTELAAGSIKDQKIAEKKDRGEKLTRLETLRSKTPAILKPSRWTRSIARNIYGTTPEVIMEKEIEKKENNYKKKFGKDIGAAASFDKQGWLGLTPESKIALGSYLAGTKGGEGLDKLNPEQLREITQLTATHATPRLENIVKHKQNLIDDSDIVKTMVPDGVQKDENGKFKDKDLRIMVDLGIKIDGQEIRELIKTDKGKEKVVREVAYKKANNALKPKDIEVLSKDTADNPKFQENAARYGSQNFIKNLGEEKGPGYIGAIQDKAEEIGLQDQIARSNPAFIKTPYSPAGGLIMRPWREDGKKVEKDDVNRWIEEARKEMRTEREKFGEEIKEEIKEERREEKRREKEKTKKDTGFGETKKKKTNKF